MYLLLISLNYSSFIYLIDLFICFLTYLPSFFIICFLSFNELYIFVIHNFYHSSAFYHSVNYTYSSYIISIINLFFSFNELYIFIIHISYHSCFYHSVNNTYSSDIISTKFLSFIGFLPSNELYTFILHISYNSFSPFNYHHHLFPSHDSGVPVPGHQRPGHTPGRECKWRRKSD